LTEDVAPQMSECIEDILQVCPNYGDLNDEEKVDALEQIYKNQSISNVADVNVTLQEIIDKQIKIMEETGDG